MSLQIHLPLNGNYNNLGTNVSTVSQNGVLFERKGPAGTSCYFNGSNNNIIVPITLSTTGMTFSCYIYSYVDPSSHPFYLFDARTSDYGYQPMYIDGTNIQSGNSSLGFPNFSYTIKGNTWYHVAVTYTTSGCNCYVNGSLIGTSSSGGIESQFSGSYNLYIGSRHSSSNWFYGDLCDFRYYDEALTSDEIKKIANSLQSFSLNDGVTIPQLGNSVPNHLTSDKTAFTPYGYSSASASSSHVNIPASNGGQTWSGQNIFNHSGFSSTGLDESGFPERPETLNYNLPSGYTVYSYMESTGGAFINTGIVFDPNTDAYLIEHESTMLSQNGMLFGSWQSQGSNYFWYYHYDSGGTISIYATNTAGSQKNASGITKTNDKLISVYENKTVYIDGVKKGSFTDSMSIPVLPMTLFGAAMTSTTITYPYIGKVYRCKIWKSGKLVRNLIPASNSSGTTGFFDTISNTFLPEQSGSGFVCGNVIGTLASGNYTLLSHVQASGNQYFDTGIIANQGMLCEFKASWQYSSGIVVGSHNPSDPYGRNAAYLNTNGNLWELGFGDVYPHYNFSSGDYNLNTIYDVRFSTIKGNGYLDVDDVRLITDSTSSIISNLDVLIFANQYPNNPPTSGSLITLYKAKIWNITGELVRDLIPAKNSSNVIGFLDIENNIFLTPRLQAATGLVRGSAVVVSNIDSSVQAGVGVAKQVVADSAYNAVWNDIADCIEVPVNTKLEFGYAYCFDGEHYYKSDKYLADGFVGIHSDTAGFYMGDKGIDNQLKTASAGFVLAYVDKDYKSGTPLTCGKDGYLTKLKDEDIEQNPHKLIGTFWKKEENEYWGFEDNRTTDLMVKVNGRKWIKVR